MKKLLLLLPLLFVLVVHAQQSFTIKYIYQYPNASQPPTNYLFLLDPGNGQYQNTSVGQLASYMATLVVFTNGGGTVVFNTLYTTNFYSTNLYTSNLYSSFFTNFTSFITNLYATTVNATTNINNYTIINNPGGFTNLNLSTNALIATDNGDNQVSVPNASGIFTNNGFGGFGWLADTLLRRLSDHGTNEDLWYPTMDGTVTFLKTNAAGINLEVLDGASVVQGYHDGTNWYGAGAGLTNLVYRYTTNNSGTTTFSWGLAYRTNIASNVTVALSSPAAAFYETTVVWVTNSSGSDFKMTFPAGTIGPVGSGTPSALYCTNKTLTRILLEHYGSSDIVVSKTDFGP